MSQKDADTPTTSGEPDAARIAGPSRVCYNGANAHVRGESNLQSLSAELIRRLQHIVGPQHVLTEPESRHVYECDAFTIQRATPDAVVLPGDTSQVQHVVRLLHEHRIPFLPRGAGTGLSGGATPTQSSVVVPLTRMNRVLAVDFRNKLALVEAGAVNLHVSRAASRGKLHFAPDPSSQVAATIGGNVAENAGGPHTLKYGVTTNHVVRLEVVLPNGDCHWLGTGAPFDDVGYDLAGLLTGSEGTMGLVTRALLRLTKLPEAERTLLAVFDSNSDATECVSDIIAQGIIPAALEMIDSVILEALAPFNLDLPSNAAALLIVELDGISAGMDDDMQRILQLCHQHDSRMTRLATTAAERDNLWQARRLAVGALGRLAPSYITQDGVVPRTKLPHILQHIAAVSAEFNIKIGNVMHAGDGNIHPIILFDERDPDQVERALQASAAILNECLALGGSVTGEHGIGIEKSAFMPAMFSPADLAAMRAAKRSFDPNGLCNAGKIFSADDAIDSLSTSPRDDGHASGL